MKHSKHIFPAIFALIVFVQLMLFHWQCFHTVIVSSLWKAPFDFMLFYLPKVGITLLLASFVYLFKSRWWTVVASLALNFWSLSELVYIRANHVPLDSWSITMVGNMEGFWGSVPLYIEPLDYALFGLTALLMAAVIISGKQDRSPFSFAILCASGVLFNIASCVMIWDRAEKEHCLGLYEAQKEDEVLPPGAEGHHLDFFISPFSRKMERQFYGGSENYLYDWSSLHAFVFNCKCLIINRGGQIELSSLSEELFNDDSEVPYPETKLVICLVESLESWAVRPEVMPNLCRLAGSGHVYFNPSVISQARRGTSADGQMIVETGLLPINGGAVCFRYPDNAFPSLSKLYKPGESCGLFPHPLDVWHQDKMSPAYGMTDNYTCSDIDTELFSKACDLSQDYKSVLFITGSTHSPFKKVCDNSSLELPEDMPSYMRDYLRSCNYFDESIGFFVDRILEDETFANTTVVITGDHTCFQDEKRVQFGEYCEEFSMDYKVGCARCPLLIVSPVIEGNTQGQEDIYQMDIFPTVLKLLGCESYCWKGFGVDVLDSTSIAHRPFTESEAFDLSDKIISSDYFARYVDLLQRK